MHLQFDKAQQVGIQSIVNDFALKLRKQLEI